MISRPWPLIRAVVFAICFTVPAPAADISGEWSFKATSPEGEHPAKLSLTQTGSKITGNFSSERGHFKVEGTVKGNEVQFTVLYTGGDEPMTVPFRGKLEGKKMSGEYTAGDATGSWSAEKMK